MAFAAPRLTGTERIHGALFSRAWRTHWMLRELGLDSEVELVHVPIHPNSGLYPGDAEGLARHVAMSPDARVPVLEVGAGGDGGGAFSVFESAAINMYLAKTQPQSSL